MKIVHVITRLILGGAQENTLITCKELSRRGHDVTLITGPAIGPEGELFEQTKNQNFKTIVVDKLVRQIHPLYDVLSYRQIKKHLKDIDPDIVHTHSAKAGVLGRLAAYKLKGDGKIPQVVHTIHGLAFHPYQNVLISRFYVAIEKTAAEWTDAFICVADAMTNQARAVGIGIDKSFTTAYSAIEEGEFLTPPLDEQIKAFRNQYDIDDDAIVLTTVARLFHLKGHKYIIESARRLANGFEKCIWLFVGDGSLTERIKNDIDELGLSDRFRFTGLLPTSKIPLVMHASDILVHCSLREGLARVLPQAMLCGKPAISFDVDGAREVVNEDTGRLIEPENIEQLSAACAELIGNEELRQKLGQNAKEQVREKFLPQTMADTIEAVYKNLMANPGQESRQPAV